MGYETASGSPYGLAPFGVGWVGVRLVSARSENSPTKNGLVWVDNARERELRLP